MALSLPLPLLCPSFSLSLPKRTCLSSSLHPTSSAGLRPVEFPRPLNPRVLLSRFLPHSQDVSHRAIAGRGGGDEAPGESAFPLSWRIPESGVAEGDWKPWRCPQGPRCRPDAIHQRNTPDLTPAPGQGGGVQASDLHWVSVSQRHHVGPRYSFIFQARLSPPDPQHTHTNRLPEA